MEGDERNFKRIEPKIKSFGVTCDRTKRDKPKTNAQ